MKKTVIFLPLPPPSSPQENDLGHFQADLGAIDRPENNDGPVFSVYIETYGCQMNVYDSQAIDDLLKRAGFNISAVEKEADIVLLNTCSVRELAEHKVVSRVGEIRHNRRSRHQDQPMIGICGCMAERMGKDLLKGQNKVDLVVGVDNYDNLPGMLRKLCTNTAPGKPASTGHRGDTHYVAPPQLYPTNNSHLVTIHKGCDYKCTYCIVPYTRGPQSEKNPEAILDEIRKIGEAGGNEITLLGQNVTAYQWGADLDFAALLKLVVAETDIQRIRFLTGHPKDMHPHLMDTIGELDKVCPWLHLPVQSGSNNVLRRMKRLYTREEYLAMVHYARKAIPNVTFSADIIVGFPGETEDDLQATLEVIREVKYDQVFSFKYSERPGVPAAKLDDDINKETKKRRLAAVIELQDEIWNEMALACVDEVWSGTIETEARRPSGAWRMRTANNRKVIVPSDSLKIGDSITARITGHSATTFSGELLDG
jgi:tRNA-2-methylthio-N6-dimethylallyladenosine synthase